MSKHLMKIAAAAAAAVIVAFGAYALGSGGSGSTGGTANASPAGGPPIGAAGATGSNGGPPQGRMRRAGAPVTGAAADKAAKAATAKYPGTVEDVHKLSDGSYIVHVITSSGEPHVLVSKDFVVIRAMTPPQGGPRGGGPGGMAPQGGVPPQGGTPPQTGATTSQS